MTFYSGLKHVAYGSHVVLEIIICIPQVLTYFDYKNLSVNAVE